MSRYRIAVPSNATATANAPRIELRAGARPFWLMELLVANEAATVVTLLMHRALAIGVTPTSPLTPQPEDDDDYVAALAATASAWGTAPTVPSTSPLARLGLPATIGAGFALTFTKGLYVATSGSLILINLAASSSAALGFTFVLED